MSHFFWIYLDVPKRSSSFGVFAGIDKRTKVYAKLLKFIDTTNHYRPDRLYGLLSEGGLGPL